MLRSILLVLVVASMAIAALWLLVSTLSDAAHLVAAGLKLAGG